MKSASDPRHQKRLKLTQELFALSFKEKPSSYKEMVRPIVANYPTIDAMIVKAAPQFPIDKVAKVDVAILRLAIFELTIEKKEPPKVIIDEAIELAKELGGEGSPAFVNGVLGTLLKKLEIHE